MIKNISFLKLSLFHFFCIIFLILKMGLSLKNFCQKQLHECLLNSTVAQRIFNKFLQVCILLIHTKIHGNTW